MTNLASEPLITAAGVELDGAIAPAFPARSVDVPGAAGPTLPAATVRLAIVTPWRISAFASGVAGVPIVTASGVDVPAALADQVIAVAARSGVTIERR